MVCLAVTRQRSGGLPGFAKVFFLFGGSLSKADFGEFTYFSRFPKQILF